MEYLILWIFEFFFIIGFGLFNYFFNYKDGATQLIANWGLGLSIFCFGGALFILICIIGLIKDLREAL